MFVPVTAEQVPALREAGLLWYKHLGDPGFTHSKPASGSWVTYDAYAACIRSGSVYAILLED